MTEGASGFSSLGKAGDRGGRSRTGGGPSAGGGARRQKGWAEAARRERRRLGTGAAPSQSRWDAGARGPATVGQSKEKQQQNVERGLPPPRRGQTPPSGPGNSAAGESTETQSTQRTTRQGGKCCGLSGEATKPVARTRAKITGQAIGPHTTAAREHRSSLEPNHFLPYFPPRLTGQHEPEARALFGHQTSLGSNPN